MELTAGDSELSVGVRLLDCDHRVLFETINEIQQSVTADKGRRRTGVLLRRLAGFTLAHFELEEEMMAATRYPGLAGHQREHKRMMEQMRELVSRHSRRGLPLDCDSLSILSRLHVSHVWDGDLRYGDWLNENGNR
ncbi:MAG: bacteriohemerythrin [Terracidiphilus sp.]|jgi:hemerythrin-like metal-binding protein